MSVGRAPQILEPLLALRLEQENARTRATRTRVRMHFYRVELNLRKAVSRVAQSVALAGSFDLREVTSGMTDCIAESEGRVQPHSITGISTDLHSVRCQVRRTY